jgi:hypothetical protein
LGSAVAVVCAAPVLAQPASSSAATAAFQMLILVMGMQLLVIL